jgi:hypothetical protein
VGGLSSEANSRMEIGRVMKDCLRQTRTDPKWGPPASVATLRSAYGEPPRAIPLPQAHDSTTTTTHRDPIELT